MLEFWDSIMFQKAYSKYIIFSPGVGIYKEENASSSTYNAILLSLKVSMQNKINIYLNSWENWPKNTSIHLQNKHS